MRGLLVGGGCRGRGGTIATTWLPRFNWDTATRSARNLKDHIQTRAFPSRDNLVQMTGRDTYARSKGALGLTCDTEMGAKLFHGPWFAQCEPSIKRKSSLSAILRNCDLVARFAA